MSWPSLHVLIFEREENPQSTRRKTLEAAEEVNHKPTHVNTTLDLTWVFQWWNRHAIPSYVIGVFTNLSRAAWKRFESGKNNFVKQIEDLST